MRTLIKYFIDKECIEIDIVTFEKDLMMVRDGNLIVITDGLDRKPELIIAEQYFHGMTYSE